MSQPQISFEFFPPQTVAAGFKLWETAQSLLPLGPRHVSVTYGAGGKAATCSQDTIVALRNQGAQVAAHLTCAGATREDVLAQAERFRALGVTEIVALRGDGELAPGGFTSSLELVSALRDAGFGVHVGAYAEPHAASQGPAADLEWLRAKFQAGASLALSQFFFEADTFLRFRDACADAGVPGPVAPGILPVHDWPQVQRFAARCGVTVPAHLAQGFETAARHGRADLFALTHATDLCTTLLEEGVEHLHFYTLNRAPRSRDICRALGLPAAEGLQKVA